MRWRILLAVLLVSSVAQAQNWSTFLDPSRAIDWTQTIGFTIPSFTVACATQPTGLTAGSAAAASNATKIQNSINSCDSTHNVVNIPAGTWFITSASINQNKVVIRGAGPLLTTIIPTVGVACPSMVGLCMANSNQTYNGSTSVIPPSGNQQCAWTGGLTQGSTTLTLSSCPAAPPVNTIAILDQANDTTDNGGVFICDANTVGCAADGPGGGNNNGRNYSGGITHSEQQVTQFLSVTPLGGGSYTVTIPAPGVYFTNIRSGQSPGAWWWQTNQNNGIENLTIDGTTMSSGTPTNFGNIGMMQCNQCWVRNVRSMNAGRYHVEPNLSYRCVIRDSYFYGALNLNSSSYAIEFEEASGCLIENNIVQQTVAPVMTGSGTGNVISYNYTVNDTYGSPPSAYMNPASMSHNGGNGFNLWEGNMSTGIWGDDTWGSTDQITLFRNNLLGWQTGKTQSTVPSILRSFVRNINYAGNILGMPGKSTQYQTFATSSSAITGNAGENTSIYSFGLATQQSCSGGGVTVCDPVSKTSAMRWGNWDSVNAATQWNSTEAAPPAVSFVNANFTTTYFNSLAHTLPASLAYNSAPSWWPSGKAFPPIGPDVSTGNVQYCTSGTFTGGQATTTTQCGGGTLTNGWASHVTSIPAQDCFLSLGGPPDGSGSVLAFDANTCFAALLSTTTSLGASTTTPVAGTNVTLTATITPSSGPTGTVTFFDGGISIGTGSVSAGVATFTVTGITLGTHTYTATYGGDGTYGSSTSGPVTVTSSPTTTYTVTAPHYTMHVGDPVPPCIIKISNGTSTVPESNTIFSGAASCSIGATSASPAGNYTITVSQGTLASLVSTDTVVTVNSQITVIPADGMGAALTAVTYPPGFFGATRFPMINLASNGIANWVGDGVTDNADAMLELTAFGRGTQTAVVSVATVSGTSTVTFSSGTQFTGLAPGSPIIIDGLINSIASVTDATHLVTTSTVEGGATLSGVQLEMPPWVVNVSGTTVTAVSGPTFIGETGNLIIGQTTFTIASVTDATHLVLTASGGTQTNKKMYEDPASCCSSGSGGVVAQNFYLPAGVYGTSQPLHLYLNYWQITGDNPQTSIIKLLPNSLPFNTGSTTEFINPQSVGGNQNFHEFLSNIGIEIGAGNPNAAPLTLEMNNVAATRNVQIWADDSVCPYALNFRRGFPGPMLNKNMSIYGCTNGISSNQNEYLTTFEGLTMEGQLGLVVDPTSHNYAFRHVLSDNPGQFLSTGASQPFGVVALLDSELLNGGASATGITVASGGAVYAKNVSVTGYLHSIVDSSTGSPVTVNGNISQSWSGAAQSLFGGSPQGSLNLPVNETPIPVDPSPSTWTVLSSTMTNWPAQISGSTSSTIYAPPGGYNTTTSPITINVPDTVNHIQFYQSKRSDNSAYLLTINVAGTSTTPLVIDGCPYTSCDIVHTGSRTLVLLDSTLDQYTAAPGAGDLYVEDSILAGTASTKVPTFYSSQHVWARHLNLEAHNINKFDCSGCVMWVLGYKTEEPFPNIVLDTGAKGEFFGVFMYGNVLPTPPQASQILITNSAVFIAPVISKVDVAGRGNIDWVTETQNTTTLNLPTSGVNSSINLSNYYSLGIVPTTGDIFTTGIQMTVGVKAQ